MLSWLNINTLYLLLFVHAGFFFWCFFVVDILIYFFSVLSLSHFLASPSPSGLLLSVPNLNSDLFDLQPAFIPAVQSTPSISNANSAWGGKLSSPFHIYRHPKTKKFDCFPINKHAWLCNNNSCDCGSTLQNGAKNQSWLSCRFPLKPGRILAVPCVILSWHFQLAISHLESECSTVMHLEALAAWSIKGFVSQDYRRSRLVNSLGQISKARVACKRQPSSSSVGLTSQLPVHCCFSVQRYNRERYLIKRLLRGSVPVNGLIC